MSNDFDSTQMEVQTLLSQALQKIQVLFPQYTALVPSDPGMAIIEILAHMTDVLKRYNDFANQSNSIIDSTLLRQVNNFARLVGATTRPKTSALAVLKFTAKSGLGSGNYPVFVAKGTAVTGGGVTFETESDMYIEEADLVGTVLSSEGRTVSNSIGGSSGLPNQRFKLIGADQSLVYANGTYRLDVDVYEGSLGGQFRWQYVASLAMARSFDSVYTLDFTDEGVFVVFGDDKNGRIPPVSAEGGIYATYRVGGGTNGMVGANILTTLVSPDANIESVTNEEQAYGALDGDNIDTARMTIPAYVKTNDRAIAPEDFKTLAERFGGVAVARSFPIAQTVYLFVVPSTGGQLTQDLQTALQAYLSTKAQQGYVISIMQANYVTVEVDFDIRVRAGFDRESVRERVRNNLISLLNPTTRSPKIVMESIVGASSKSSLFVNDFGSNLHRDALHTVVRNTPGVEYGDLKALRTARNSETLVEQTPIPDYVAVNDFEIIRQGTLFNITVLNTEKEFLTTYDPSKERATI